MPRSRVRPAVIHGSVLLAVAFIAIALTIAFGLLIRGFPRVEAVDDALVQAANGGLTPATARLAIGIDVVFGPRSAILLTLLLAAIIALLRRRVRAGIQMVALVAVPWGAVAGIKLVVQRPRPQAELLTHQLVPSPESFSYPSGHTAFAAAISIALLCALRVEHGGQGPLGRRSQHGQYEQRGPGGRGVGVPGIVLAVLVIGVTAWSRVALGMHHPTDVLASALLVPILGLVLARLLALLRPVASIEDPARPDATPAVLPHPESGPTAGAGRSRADDDEPTGE